MEWLRKLIGWWLSLFGRKESIAPSKPADSQTTAHTKGETAPTPPKITEPEFELASSEPPKYKQWDSVFTYRERVFFKALLEDVGDQFQIFAKVRMGDIFKLANEPENRKFHNNQLQCKHLDFLVCDKGSYKSLLAIELDDSSHDKYDNRDRDEFKERVCKEAGLKLWRLRVQQTYPNGYIGEQVRSAIQEKTTS
ncbi:MAG: DUF2726 domain-containing protein [Chloroflexota bacterium]